VKLRHGHGREAWTQVGLKARAEDRRHSNILVDGVGEEGGEPGTEGGRAKPKVSPESSGLAAANVDKRDVPEGV
jgi:hypothetical protein